MLIRPLLLSLLLLLTLSAKLDAQESYLLRDYGRFVVACAPPDTVEADRVHDALEQQLPVLARRLRVQLPDSAIFWITPTIDEWRRRTEGSPLWANGIARPARAEVFLKSSRFNVNRGPIEETAVHELLHLILGTGARGAGFPKWFDEGLAQYMAGQWEYEDVSTLSHAAASGTLFRFSEIQGMMGMPDVAARQAYAQSLAAVQDLANRVGGDSGLSNLISAVRKGQDFEEAFATLFGLSIVQFEQEHLEALRAEYGSSIWTDGELWISVLFVILVLAAGGAAYFRRKRTLARWREELVPSEREEAREVPYVVDYSIVRRSTDDDPEEPPEGVRHDKPISGN